VFPRRVRRPLAKIVQREAFAAVSQTWAANPMTSSAMITFSPKHIIKIVGFEFPIGRGIDQGEQQG
jgi:hypothetical protein